MDLRRLHAIALEEFKNKESVNYMTFNILYVAM
jgi:hypothetical protein